MERLVGCKWGVYRIQTEWCNRQVDLIATGGSRTRCACFTIFCKRCHHTEPCLRILALDFGKRRIGLAISDELGITAQGLETLQRTTIREDIDGLAQLIAERNVGLILMGNPLHMSGAESRQADYVRDFASRLSARTGVDVKYWDERLTTVAAQRVLKQSGISIQKRAQAVDRLAAVILLESYLDSLHYESTS